MTGRRAVIAGALCSIAAASATGGCGTRPAPVDVRIVDHKALMQTVAGHRGKVVVLDCWSTSCPPCVRDFPGFVALADKRHPDVVCLSLSFDYEGIGAPEEVLRRVRAFLTAVGAGAIDNLLGREDSDGLYKKLGLASVPAVYVWGRDGKLARRFDDDAARRLGRPFTYADVEATVLELRGR